MTAQPSAGQSSGNAHDGASPLYRPGFLQVLAEALEQLTSAETRSAVFAALRIFARRLVQADGVAIVLREGDKCFYAQTDSPDGPLWEGQRFPLMSCISGWAMLNRETAVVPDVFQDPRVPHAVYRPTFVNSLVMVPVGRGADGALAAIGAYWAKVRQPGDDEVALLETLARATGGALARCAAYERIRASEQRLRSIFSNTVVGLGIGSADGILTETNARYAAMFGYEPQALPGRSICALSHPDDVPVLARLTARFAAGEISHFDLEQRYFHQSGCTVWVNSVFWAIDQDGDNPRLLVCAVLDITRQKEAEAQLSWAQRMDALGQLTSGIAHDFNNLLTVINGSAELLAEAVSDRPKVRELAGIVVAAGEKGSVLTERLQSFTRRQAEDPQALRPDEVLAGMRAMLATTLHADTVLTLDLACPDSVVIVDPTQFETAILNLVLNARDAMPHGGRLTIGTTRAGSGPGDDQCASDAPLLDDGHVAISVCDTGTGMAPEVQVRAFEPFFTTKAKGAGTGLGLSMVYGFARQAHGVASIDSHPGKGSVITLCLPEANGRAQRDERQR